MPASELLIAGCSALPALLEAADEVKNAFMRAGCSALMPASELLIAGCSALPALLEAADEVKNAFMQNKTVEPCACAMSMRVQCQLRSFSLGSLA
jgi:hypothetical protein